jgi:hypothetical protein
MVPETFTFRLVGTTGCEILADGVVVAWTTDGYWAAVIVGLLDGAAAQAPCLLAAVHGAAGNPFALNRYP